MPRVIEAFRLWLPIAVAVTVLCLLLDGAVQQNYRTSANDPQVQLAEDAANSLAAGESPRAVTIHRPVVDIARSLAVWLAVYNPASKPVASSGKLDGALPGIPSGVFTAAQQSGENRVTWQPRPGVRSALVVVPYPGPAGGFVVAGRSLREVEEREGALSRAVTIGWIVALIAAFVAAWLVATERG